MLCWVMELKHYVILNSPLDGGKRSFKLHPLLAPGKVFVNHCLRGRKILHRRNGLGDKEKSCYPELNPRRPASS